MPAPDTLPPLSGIPAHAHHFAAGWRTSACGRTVPARALRLAWLAWDAPSRPHCQTCARCLGVE